MNRMLRSFKDAFSGIIFCIKTQPNMVIHLVIGLLVFILALLLRVTALELLILLGVIFAVFTAEAFNTALEKAVDVATREQNRLAHAAKDVAAGAVLLTAIFAVLAGVLIFGPRIWRLFY